jgi:hypothetical protein
MNPQSQMTKLASHASMAIRASLLIRHSSFVIDQFFCPLQTVKLYTFKCQDARL